MKIQNQAQVLIAALLLAPAVCAEPAKRFYASPTPVAVTAPPIEGGPPVGKELLRELELALARYGFDPGEPDGVWTHASQAALLNFQLSAGLDPSGAVTLATLERLGLGTPPAIAPAPGAEAVASAEEYLSPPPHASDAPGTAVSGQDLPVALSRDLLRDVEERLNRSGFSAGEPDGQWTQASQNALLAYQRHVGIEASGELTRRTLYSLGIRLGASPPREPPRRQSPAPASPSGSDSAPQGGAQREEGPHQEPGVTVQRE